MIDRTEVETWKPIPEWEGYYEASDLGRIRSVDRIIERAVHGPARVRGVTLKPGVTSMGRLQVALTRGGKSQSLLVHRLVLLAFEGPCPDGMECCHGNDIPTDNRLANLRWGTRSENLHDKVRNNLDHNASKSECANGHPFDDANTYIRPGRGGRQCKACNRDRARLASREARKDPARRARDAAYLRARYQQRKLAAANA